MRAPLSNYVAMGISLLFVSACSAPKNEVPGPSGAEKSRSGDPAPITPATDRPVEFIPPVSSPTPTDVKAILAGRSEPTPLTLAMIRIYTEPKGSTQMNALYAQAIDQIVIPDDHLGTYSNYVEAKANVKKLKDAGAFSETMQDRTTTLNVLYNQHVQSIRDEIYRDHVKTGVVLAGLAIVAGGLAGRLPYIRSLIGRAPQLLPEASVVADAVSDTFLGSASKLPNAVMNAMRSGLGRVGGAAKQIWPKPELVRSRLVKGGLRENDSLNLKLEPFLGTLGADVRFSETNLPGISYAEIPAAGGHNSSILFRYARKLNKPEEGYLVQSRELEPVDLKHYQSRLAEMAEANKNKRVVVEVDTLSKDVEILDTPANAILSVIESDSLVPTTNAITEAGGPAAFNPALKKFDLMTGGFVTLGVGGVEAVAYVMAEDLGAKKAQSPPDLYLDSVLPAATGPANP